MWWFAALHANLVLLYARMGGRAAGRRLLDAGCGTGGLLARLSARCRMATRQMAECQEWRNDQGSMPTILPANAPAPRADARSAPARSMRCPLPMARSARSSAPMCCAMTGSTSGGAGAVSPLSVRPRHSDPEPAGLSLDDVGPRPGGRQCPALYEAAASCGCSKAPGSGRYSRAIGTRSCSR